MATPGVPFSQSYTVHQSPEVIGQALFTSATGIRDYSVSSAGTNTLVFTRKYWPTWVIVVAVVGALFFFLGLLILFYRETETLTVSLTGSGVGATTVVVVGTASPELIARLQQSMTSIGGATCRHCGTWLESGAQFCKSCGKAIEVRSPSGCPSCGTALPTGASFCPACGTRAH
jgi:hypothetical protein